MYRITNYYAIVALNDSDGETAVRYQLTIIFICFSALGAPATRSEPLRTIPLETGKELTIDPIKCAQESTFEGLLKCLEKKADESGEKSTRGNGTGPSPTIHPGY